MDPHERTAVKGRLARVKEAIHAHLHSGGPPDERTERWQALLAEFIDLHVKLDESADAPARQQKSPVTPPRTS